MIELPRNRWKIWLTVEKNDDLAKYYDQLIYVIYGATGKSRDICLGIPCEDSETATVDEVVLEVSHY